MFNVSVIEWTNSATTLLISTYAELKPLFSDAHYKKKDVWGDVAKNMLKFGYNFSALECSKKWSNLELRFLRCITFSSLLKFQLNILSGYLYCTESTAESIDAELVNFRLLLFPCT